MLSFALLLLLAVNVAAQTPPGFAVSPLFQADTRDVTPGTPSVSAVFRADARAVDGLKAWAESAGGTIGSGGSPLWPALTGVSPFPVPASGTRQWLTLHGSGFTAGSQVILRAGTATFPLPPDRVVFAGATQLRVFAGVTDEPADWTAQVVNPGGGASGQFVIRPGAAGFSPGHSVRVAGTGGLGLRLRAAPALTAAVLRVLPEGTAATVLGGPVAADGHAWWRLSVGGAEGWAAGGYLARDEAGENSPPEVPAGLAQFNAATGMPLAAGAQLTGDEVAFAATVGDPDQDPVRLQIELRRHDQGWTGSPTHSSPLTASGSRVSVAGGPLGSGAYKWRARLVDAQGLPGGWAEFSGAGVAFTLDASRPPAATFDFVPATPLSGQPVTFVYTGERSAGQTYAWDFGAGPSAGGGQVAHTFPHSGVYRVALTVRRADGTAVTGEREVPVASGEILAAVDRLVESVHAQLEGILADARKLAEAADVYYAGISATERRIGVAAVLQVVFSGVGASLPDLPPAREAALAALFGVGEEAGSDLAAIILNRKAAPQQSFRTIFLPALERKVAAAKQELAGLRNEALASTPNLSPAQIAALVRDLNARRSGGIQRQSLYQQQAHLPVTFAELRGMDEASWTYRWGRYGLAGSLGLLDYALTINTGGASKVLMFGLFSTIGVYQNVGGNLQSLSADGQMFSSALNALGEGFLALEDIHRNARGGLTRVKEGAQPARVAGSLTITHRTEGGIRVFGHQTGWRPDAAYSLAAIENTGDLPAQFVVAAVYPVRFTTTDIFPWLPTGGVGARRYEIHVLNGSDPLTLNPGQATTWDLPYLKDGAGGGIPREPIAFTLFAKASDGLYLLAQSVTRFGTTFIEDGRILPAEETEELKLMRWRFQAGAEPLNLAGDFRISLRLQNPEASPLKVNLSQALPPGVELTRVLSHEGDALDWEADLAPESARLVEFEVRLRPGIEGATLPGAALSLHDTVRETWVPFTLNEVRLGRPVPDPGLLDAISASAGAVPGGIGLGELAALGVLQAGGRGITNLSGLEHAWLLEEVHLNHNGITDLGPLASLYRVRTLNLAGNRITDLRVLVELARNGGLGVGALVDLRGNPLELTAGTQARAHYEELLGHGVQVLVGDEAATMAYADWMEARLVPSELRAPGADASGDGLPNLLAYLFNVDPLNGRDPADVHALPRAGFESVGGRTYLLLVYRANQRATGLGIYVLGSATLEPGSWQAVTPESREAFALDPVTRDPLYRVRIDVTGKPQFFARLAAALAD